ncbi:lim and transglutaminase domain protein ltd-1-like [Symsagittifera roscoffensis]|uniref:lim and transglutaminase domain protein ltd-1-like n=1 Tax=Symsagittifera roscoffensis TaxID=84072 RepID=UPI00307C59B1
MGCGASNSSAPVAFKSKVSPEPTFAAVEQRRKSRVDPIQLKNWPEPCPPATYKEDIFKQEDFKQWDQRALTVRNYGIPNDFLTLSRYLCDGASNELSKVRAIYIWVTTQDCNQVDNSVQVDLNSPLGYLAALKQEKGSYAGLFGRICTESDVPCVTIRGFAKGVGYQPGQKMDAGNFGASWNAVLIDKYWRLIDVHWGARFITGDDKKDDWKLIDSDTSAAVDKTQTMTYDSDDFYFLSDPDKLIFSHFPDEQRWQLLDTPKQIAQFERQAFIKRHFFKLGLSIKSHPDAIIECPEGESDIQFALPMHTWVTFAYKLFAISSSTVEKNIVSSASKLGQFVIQQSMNKIISFNLSFPMTGNFLIELYATAESLEKDANKRASYMNHVCSYIINCTKAKPDCEALPKTASLKGFGPGIDAIRKSLVPLSHQSGVIITATGQVEVRFKMENGLVDFAHFLHSNKYDDEKLENYCVHRFVDDEVIFSVNLPSNGDFTLDIFGELENKEDNKSLPHICSYLIRCNKPGITNPPFAATLDSMFGVRGEKKYMDKNKIKFNPQDPFIVTDSGEVVIEVESDPSITFQGALEYRTPEDQSEPMNDHVFFERTGYVGKLQLTLPKAGFYRLGVFTRKKSKPDADPVEVFNYLINCTSVHADLIQYPVPFANWTEDCVLYEPKQGLLPYDEEINFSVSIPGAESVFVVRPGEANEEYEKVCPLTRSADDDDTWDGSIKTGVSTGDLQLAVIYKNGDHPQGLLKFEVHFLNMNSH